MTSALTEGDGRCRPRRVRVERSGARRLGRVIDQDVLENLAMMDHLPVMTDRLVKEKDPVMTDQAMADLLVEKITLRMTTSFGMINNMVRGGGNLDWEIIGSEIMDKLQRKGIKEARNMKNIWKKPFRFLKT